MTRIGVDRLGTRLGVGSGPRYPEFRTPISLASPNLLPPQRSLVLHRARDCERTSLARSRSGSSAYGRGYNHDHAKSSHAPECTFAEREMQRLVALESRRTGYGIDSPACGASVARPAQALYSTFGCAPYGRFVPRSTIDPPCSVI